jgi:hypothetical protein
MFHVEHSRRTNLATLPDFRCGKIAGNAVQLSSPAQESLRSLAAPKSVIAIRSRFELFCEVALGFSEKTEWDAFSL